jgi:hypothetical protein
LFQYLILSIVTLSLSKGFAHIAINPLNL